MIPFQEICTMFTGIIETQGIIKKIEVNGSNKTFWIRSSLSEKLKPDQSVAHDGVCLTVEEVKRGQHRVTAIAESLAKTTLENWQTGNQVNLERCLRLKDRLNGHFVTGHVDTTAICTEKTNKNGSWELGFQFPDQFNPLIIEKGSIALNGISLTVFQVSKNTFRVALIPYTFKNTNLNSLEPGQKVNLEFDLIGKYIHRKLSLDK